jgi:hypothetical protein
LQVFFGLCILFLVAPGLKGRRNITKTIMTTELSRLYARFRPVTHTAKEALRSAKILLRFRELESDGLVRLRCGPEEGYFDAYGKPEAYVGEFGRRVSAKQATKELEDLLERLGVWWTCSEWFDGENWQHADSCGMHTGYQNAACPFQNCYVVDEMEAAIELAENHLAEMKAESINAFDAACRDIVTA